MPENIDAFNHGVALILERLYAEFPTPIYLKITTLDDFANAERRRLYADTAAWLAGAGFIAYREALGGELFAATTLTLKGLELLNRRPAALEQRVSLGEHLKTALKEGSKEALRAAVGLVLEAMAHG